MLLILNIPNSKYDRVLDKNTLVEAFTSDEAVALTDDATNEDVLKAVFPNFEEEMSTNGESLVLERFTPYCKMQLHKDWLDATYKKGAKL